VEGEPLDKYCKQRQCSVRERLALFHAVCEAVQHAHGRNIIHGDLKPSNIRVKEGGEPKLLDFGLAEQFQSAGDTVTQSPAALGYTPAYASPEQFRGEPISVYIDIYALGVILYELLTGALPFNASRYTYAEIKEIKTRERVPEPPSAIARASGAEGSQLSKAEWRDLDAVCLKALASHVNGRYTSVDALIQDLDRYIGSEPLAARLPHPAGYRLGKFFKRNRRAVLIASLILTAIIGMVTVFAVRLKAERDRALAASARVRRVEQFTEDLFQGGDDEAGTSKDLLVVTLLDRGATKAKEMTADPEVQANFYQTLGTAYEALGKLDRAESLLQLALSMHRSIYGADHEEVADTLLRLSALRLEQGQMPEAEQLAREAVAMNQRHLPPADPAIAVSMMNLGTVLEQRGAYDEAIQVLNDALRIHPPTSEASKKMSPSLTLLANAYFYKGDLQHAYSLNQQALAEDRRLYGDHHPNLAEDLMNLGNIQNQWGHYAEAEKYYRQALNINQAWYGKDSEQAADSTMYVAQTLEMQSREEEAQQLLEGALATLERVYGKVHPRVAIALGDLGAVAKDRGRLDEAEADFSREFEIFRSVYGDDHQHTAVALSNLTSIYVAKKQFAKAEAGYRDVIRRFEQTVSPDNVNMGIARIKLGDVLLSEKRYRDAEPELLEGYQILLKQTDQSSYWATAARKDLAAVYDALKEPDKAAELRQKARERASK